MVDTMVSSLYFLPLATAASRENTKNLHVHGFVRDHVARGSSGLKPLRRRAPTDRLAHAHTHILMHS